VETVPEPVHKKEMPEERVRPVVRVQPEPEAPAPRQNVDARTSPMEAEIVEIDDDEDAAAESASPGLLQKILKKKLVLAVVGGVLLLCSGALFVYPGMFKASSRPPVALTLRVERSAGDLLLTWNRESEVIRNAKHAVLSIYDGERTENYNMDLNQLRDGSIVYAPLTPDVSFKMEVTGPDGSKVAAESVRVLRTRPSPMPDENAAKNAQQQGKTPAATPAPDAAAAAAQEAATAEKTAEEQAPAPTKLAQASRAFNVASLAQRLRPVTDSDLPDAPTVGAAPRSAPIAGLNLGGASGPALTPRKTASEGSSAGASQLQQATVVKRVSPVYPAIAQRANAAGTVRLTAIVGTDGKVKRVVVNSGNPLLQQAAADAVKQWVYNPTLLNGKPVESEVEVSLEFKR
jgi:protein TonB